MPHEIVIVDYGMGNLNSVSRKLLRIGVHGVSTSDPESISSAGKIILPGVGHFQTALGNIKKMDLWDVLNDAVLIRKVPILGVCLGMQLMAKFSEEGNCTGFGWFDADVIKFRVGDTLKYKVPHIGWNQIITKRASPLFDNVDSSDGFYFVHSYHVKCNNYHDVLSETIYEYPFVSAIQKDNIFGVQFHPEKSHNAGEEILKNFIRM